MPGELAPWYALVEQRLKLAGARDGVPWLPDSELEYFLEPNADEIALQSAIAKRWPMREPIVGQRLAIVRLRDRVRCGFARKYSSWLVQPGTPSRAPDSELEYFLEPNADEIALQSAIAKRWPFQADRGPLCASAKRRCGRRQDGAPVCPRSRCRAEGSRPFRASAWDRVGRPKRPLRARRGAADLSVRLDPGIDAPAIAFPSASARAMSSREDSPKPWAGISSTIFE